MDESIPALLPLIIVLVTFSAVFIIACVWTVWGDLKIELKNIFRKLFVVDTPIQKEIKAEQKEIKRLEQHKADMEELERLKVHREKLFEEVQESEVEREEVLVICDSCGNYMDYLGIDRSRREVYECKDCNLTLKAPLCTN